jgi:hypothetical protein
MAYGRNGLGRPALVVAPDRKHRVPDAGADSEGESLTPCGCFCSWTLDP